MVIQQDFIHTLKNLSTCLVYEKLKDYSCVEYHAIYTHIIRGGWNPIYLTIILVK